MGKVYPADRLDVAETQNGAGTRLRNLRRRAGLTLRQPGDRCGITASHLSNLGRGRSSPTLATLPRVLHARDVSGILLSGTLERQIDGEAPVIMCPSDAFYTPENTRHWGGCLGREPARLVTVYVHPRYWNPVSDLRVCGTVEGRS